MAQVWHSLKHFFQVTTILTLGQLRVRYEPALRVRSAIFVDYSIKCKFSTPDNRHGGQVLARSFECPLMRLVV